MDSGLLVARLIFGFAVAAHGAQKLFGWFGGGGVKQTAGAFEMMGFRPGVPFAIAAGLGEFVGGVLIALGLLGPVGPALVIVVMIVAAVAVHLRHGFFARHNGVEVPLLYFVGALLFAFVGPGAYSLDAALGLQSLWTPRLAWESIVAALVLSAANLALRRVPRTATPQAAS